MNEAFPWTDFTGDALTINVPYTVLDADGKEVWSGPAVGVVETPTGGLSIRRLVLVDGHQVTAEVELLAKGTWARASAGGFVADMEQIRFNEHQMRAAQEANAAHIEQARREAERARTGLAVPVPLDGRRPPFN